MKPVFTKIHTRRSATSKRNQASYRARLDREARERLGSKLFNELLAYKDRPVPVGDIASGRLEFGLTSKQISLIFIANGGRPEEVQREIKNLQSRRQYSRRRGGRFIDIDTHTKWARRRYQQSPSRAIVQRMEQLEPAVERANRKARDRSSEQINRDNAALAETRVLEGILRERGEL